MWLKLEVLGSSSVTGPSSPVAFLLSSVCGVVITTFLPAYKEPEQVCIYYIQTKFSQGMDSKVAGQQPSQATRPSKHTGKQAKVGRTQKQLMSVYIYTVGVTIYLLLSN